ncbi:MAG: ZIP family metal transporter, partial [Clostridia bacterium]|nr:ZIP family metal transporter [Clostridia bacterium]
MDYLAIIIITLISGVIGTGLGGAVGAILRRESNKIVSLLLSFAGGIMLAVVCFDLMNQPVEMMKEGTLPSYTPVIVVLAAAIGYAVVYILNHVIDKHANKEVKHIDKNHPTTADDLDELIHADHFESHKEGASNSRSNLFIAGLVMMIAIALHNLPEGMVIGASYAMEEDLTANLFSSTGFIMAIVIGLHNVPEGMAVSVPLISGGMGKVKAVLLTALSGLPTVFGALLGYALGGISPVMLVLSLGFASGAMLYVVFGELLPESILMWKSKLPAVSVFIGVPVSYTHLPQPTNS